MRIILQKRLNLFLRIKHCVSADRQDKIADIGIIRESTIEIGNYYFILEKKISYYPHNNWSIHVVLLWRVCIFAVYFTHAEKEKKILGKFLHFFYMSSLCDSNL